jgi:uncharacterized membrane protein YfcA
MSASRKQLFLITGVLAGACVAIVWLTAWLASAGLAVVVIGVPAVGGGLIGAYGSLKDARGPRERAFVILAAIVCCAAVGAAVAVLHRQWPWMWVVYLLLLPVALRHANRMQTAIRREEQGNSVRKRVSD